MNRRLKLFIPIALFLIMGGLLYFGLGRDPNQVPSALVNRPVPEFSLPALFEETKTYTEADLTGGIFLVNVWGSWCPPCHAEHPYLMEISKREKNITLVGVNYKDDLKEAREFLNERGNPFAFNVVDLDGKLGIDLGVAGAPETFIVDASGTIRYRHVGVINDRNWKETFEPIIASIR